MDKLVSHNIDLNAPEVNESILLMFSGAVKLILKSLFGSGSVFKGTVKGTPQQIDVFTKALAGEKKYMYNFNKFGLNDPKTYKSKTFLNKAIENFEKATKFKWPFN